MKRQVLLIVLVLASLTGTAYSLGVSPPKIEDNFAAGTVKAYEFYAVNRAGEPINASISARGDLAQYVSFADSSLELQPNSLVKTHFTVSYPQALEKPGKHDTRIVLTEVPASAGEELGSGSVALAEVEMYFFAYSPYPGQYLDYALGAKNTPVGQTVPITLTLYNRGSEETQAATSFYVFDDKKNQVADLGSNTTSVKAGESVVQAFGWKTKGIQPGVYTAKTTTTYASKTDTNTVSFKVGELNVTINELRTPDAIAGSIAKVMANVESWWSQDITDAYLEVQVSKNGVNLTNGRSSTRIITAWKTTWMDAFIETSKLQAGSYDLNAVLHYADKTTGAQGTLNVVEGEKAEANASAGFEKLLSATTLLRKESTPSGACAYYLVYTAPSDVDGTLTYDIPFPYDGYASNSVSFEPPADDVKDKDGNILASWNVQLKAGNAFTAKISAACSDAAESGFKPPKVSAKNGDMLWWAIGVLVLLIALAAAAYLFLVRKKDESRKRR